MSTKPPRDKAAFDDDGSSKKSGGFRPFSRVASPFAIGLRPVNPAEFLHIDQELQRYRSEKTALMQDHFSAIVRSTKESVPAQREAHQLIVDCLKNHPAAPYRFDDGNVIDAGTGEVLEFTCARSVPIADASLLVQDDLLLLQRDDEGWRLTAASLAFPSSWRLEDKFGKVLEDIHAPVPYLAGKVGDRIRRIFDNLRPDCPVWRENWSLSGSDRLRQDRAEKDRTAAYRRNEIAGPLFVRAEYQTLHKLARSGAVLFTVKILNQPLEHYVADEERRAALSRQLQALGTEGIAYKGLEGMLDAVIDRINAG